MEQLLTEDIRKFIGVETAVVLLEDVVEKGAVRRFAQAVMDTDPAYMHPAYASRTRYAKPVAPPMFPVTMLRTGFGAADPVAEHADDPDYDGLAEWSSMGLPPLPLANRPQLNAGCEFEMRRLACHGDSVRMQSRYLDIHERVTSRGPTLFVITETDFTDAAGELICRFRKTLLRR